SNFNYLSPATIADTFSLGVNGSGANIVPYSGLYIESNSFNSKGNALVALNQTGNGDIFTASSAGSTRFVINASGNIGIGTTNTNINTVTINGGLTTTGDGVGGMSVRDS